MAIIYVRSCRDLQEDVIESVHHLNAQTRNYSWHFLVSQSVTLGDRIIGLYNTLNLFRSSNSEDLICSIGAWASCQTLIFPPPRKFSFFNQSQPISRHLILHEHYYCSIWLPLVLFLLLWATHLFLLYKKKLHINQISAWLG